MTLREPTSTRQFVPVRVIVAPVAKDYFDDQVARHYDAYSDEMFDDAVLAPTVRFLANLVGSGAALELGIGTGRIALPLSRLGIQVHGIDLSTAMISQLRSKPGADIIGVTIGDFATSTVGATFGLAYLVYNTITNLTTQDAQVACFRNVAAHLDDGGYFVVEVFIPELRRLPPGESIRTFTASPTRIDFDEYEVATQALRSHHYRMVDGRLDGFSVPFRYVWPSELDLMAQLAGMTLRQRWSDWNRSPFTNESTTHVSVWQKVG